MGDDRPGTKCKILKKHEKYPNGQPWGAPSDPRALVFVKAFFLFLFNFPSKWGAARCPTGGLSLLPPTPTPQLLHLCLECFLMYDSNDDLYNIMQMWLM